MVRPTSPQTTLVILIGASRFPYSEVFQPAEAFKLAADDVYDYFIGSFGLPQDNFQTFFNVEFPPYDLQIAIDQFLQERRSKLHAAGIQPLDLIIYYIGHGSFDEQNNFFLALPTTLEANRSLSSLVISNFATTIKYIARDLRTFLILDACFSGSAAKYFQGMPAASMAAQAAQVPASGLVFLCSSGSTAQSRISKDGKHTVFSRALLSVLRGKQLGVGEKLTLRQVVDATWRRIQEDEMDPLDKVQPMPVPPQPADQALLDLPLFPNDPIGEAKRSKELEALAKEITAARQKLAAKEAAQQELAVNEAKRRQQLQTAEIERIRARVPAAAPEEAEEATLRSEMETVLDRDPSPDLTAQWLKWQARRFKGQAYAFAKRLNELEEKEVLARIGVRSSREHAAKLRREGFAQRDVNLHLANAVDRAKEGAALQPALNETRRLIEEAGEKAEYYKLLSTESIVADLLTKIRAEREAGRPVSMARHVEARFAQMKEAERLRDRRRRVMRAALSAVMAMAVVAILYACSTPS